MKQSKLASIEYDKQIRKTFRFDQCVCDCTYKALLVVYNVNIFAKHSKTAAYTTG